MREVKQLFKKENGKPPRERRGVRAGKHFGRRTSAGKYLDGEPPRVSIVGVYDCYRFCCGGFLGAEPARASILDGEPPLASGLAHVRGVPFLLLGISRLTLEMTTLYVWFNSVNCDVSTSFAPEMTLRTFGSIRLIVMYQRHLRPK